jgi:hypothetical protein
MASIATACDRFSPNLSVAPVATPVLPDVPFGKLDHDQRVQLMKERVVPAVGPLFQRHAPKFASFGCKTCHGDDPSYRMPNPDLPKLGDMTKFETRDVEWMEHDIEPAMVKLLGEPEATKDNPGGFGCLSCHTQD